MSKTPPTARTDSLSGGQLCCVGVVLTLLLSVSVQLLLEVNGAQPNPYMDELFHVPQAQKYCEGNFTEWDPMITTLPGLYLVSVTVLKPIGMILHAYVNNPCSTFYLRCVNIGFLIGNLLVLRKLLRRQQPTLDVSRCLATTLTLTTLPVLYFFTFLYYTDAGSTFFILLAYLLSTYNRHWLASVAGIVAVLFRQTNIVWIAFTAGVSALDVIRHLMQKKSEKQESSDEGLAMIKFLQYRATKSISSCVDLLISVARVILPYILVAVGFVAFVYFNNGIVVGARTDHQVVLHIPQLFYFFAFTGIFACTHFLNKKCIVEFIKFIRNHPFLLGLIVLICGVSVWKCTHVHRYTLADNRHYTFYIWGRLLGRYALVRYALIPGYVFVGLTMWHMLCRSRNALWTLVYMISVVLNLVPSSLLELRYFIVPYLLFRIHTTASRSYVRLILELLLYTVVNVFTLYMFLKKPFKWPDSDDVQRFMW